MTAIGSPPVGHPDAHAELGLAVTGMHCASCVRSIERALEGVEGVSEASASLVEEVVRVRFDPSGLGPDALVGAVEAAGYGAEVLAGADAATEAEIRQGERREAEERALRRRLWTGLGLGAPIVLIGHWGMIPGLPAMGEGLRTGLEWTSGVLALPILLYSGWGFFHGAWLAARRGAAEMNTLIALGTGAAWLYSTVALAAPALFPEGSARPFYETVAVVITLVLLGQGIEARARRRTAEALRALFDLAPETAERLDGGKVETVPVATISPGDLVLVRPGARVPLDGRVTSGESDLNESMLTGESAPALRVPGDEVVGGTINGTGALTVEVTRVGADTLLARIGTMVRRAQATKPPIQRTIDEVARFFVPSVVVVAIATFGVWMAVGPDPQLSYAMTTAVAVLVIACPCALGLATPISVMIAIGNAARRGVLVRDGQALQRARRVDTVVLDKTGTLTVGRPEVVFAETVGDAREADYLAAAASVEARAEHAAARAIVAYAEERGFEWPEVEHFAAHPGKGASGFVEGRRVLVGSPSFAAEAGVDTVPLSAQLAEVAAQGATPVMVVLDGRARGLLGLADTLRPGARDAVARLRGSGVDVVMLTGDAPAPARRVAEQVGIQRVSSRVSPTVKARAIERLQGEGRVVAMVGDGINDAPALAMADVGVAMGSGTDVALQTGDVALLGDSLHGIETLIGVSRATGRNIAQNLVGAFAYNVLGIPIAAGVLYPSLGVLLSPMIAGAAMAFSSVTVVANANRLRARGPDSGTRGGRGFLGRSSP